MKERCIFRVQFVGNMWRVIECSNQDNTGLNEYRIVLNRRVIEKLRRTNGQKAIERCMMYALGCIVDISWGEVL